MSRTRANLIANFVGRFWTAALALLLIPLYVRLAGSDGYGLIAFFASVQLIVTVFDLGASATVSREMARFSVDPSSAPEAPSLVRTMEIPYWGVGLLLGAAMAAAVPFIAGGIKTTMPLYEVEQALLVMAVVVALQWPLTFYAGAIMGLQRQTLWNVINATAAAVRGGGAVAVLMFISPTATAFFTWQAVASALHTAAAAIALWRIIPRTAVRPRFHLALLRRIYRFALAVSGFSILIVILTQLDKVILSRVVTLAEFGEYSLATSLATAIYLCCAPVSDAYLPRLAQLAATNDRDALRSTFRSFSQLMSVVAAPVSAVLIVFAEPVLRTWTRNAALAGRVSAILVLLTIGCTLTVTMAVLDILQQACGWLRPALTVRVAALLLIGPAMVYASVHYGTLGAAATLAGTGLIYFVVTPQLTLRRLMSSNLLPRWYAQDMVLPLAAALIVCVVLRVCIAPPGGWISCAVYLAAAGMLSLLAAALTTPVCRALVRSILPAQRRFIGPKPEIIS
jgi:O-antigen/teichoic acid export membrane protein